VVFRPTTAGAKTATLTVTDTSSGSTTQVVNLTGTGVAAAYGTITPASLTFNPTQVGSTSATQTLTLRNTGSAALVWTTITPPAGFTVAANSSCVTMATKLLNPNVGSCSIIVAFAPLVGQAYTGNLAIVDNTNVPPTVVNGVTVPGNPTTTQNVALTGTGVAIPAVGPAPTVSNVAQTGLTLTWAPVTGAANYRVQRATNATFTTGLVTSANQAGTTFTVTNLTGNTNYYFRVVAVNSLNTATNGLASGAVLTIPGRPSGVTGTNGNLGGSITGSVSWTAPVGGAASYLVSWTGGSATTTAAARTYNFTTAGTYSLVTVTAVNASGSSTPSTPTVTVIAR